MQRNCIFPGRYAPLTYYDWLRGRPRNTLMARNARDHTSAQKPTQCVKHAYTPDRITCIFV